MTPSDGKSGAIFALTIHGMTCAGCSKTVERVLHLVPGVSEAEVDLKAERALVQGHANPDAAIAALRAAGFDAAVVADGSGRSA